MSSSRWKNNTRLFNFTYLFQKAHAVREDVQVEGEFPPDESKNTVLLPTQEHQELIEIVAWQPVRFWQHRLSSGH